MSIWEVRNNKQNFVYSKIMLWVAFDRGLRLAEKRCLPCPNRAAWLAARDEIYEDIMTKGIYNQYLVRLTYNDISKVTAAPCAASSRVTRVATP
jgi:GH15 family glucan-1,4-alpha-glucosidase